MRKLYAFSLVLTFCFNLNAQDKQNQNVELPDFVITGKNVINVKSANKKAPPVLEIISNNFLQPVYSTENLIVKEIKSKNINPLTFKKKDKKNARQMYRKVLNRHNKGKIATEARKKLRRIK